MLLLLMIVQTSDYLVWGTNWGALHCCSTCLQDWSMRGEWSSRERLWSFSDLGVCSLRQCRKPLPPWLRRVEQLPMPSLGWHHPGLQVSFHDHACSTHLCKYLIFNKSNKRPFTIPEFCTTSPKKIEKVFFSTTEDTLSQENNPRFWGRMLKFSKGSAVRSNRLSCSWFILCHANKTNYVTSKSSITGCYSRLMYVGSYKCRKEICDRLQCITILFLAQLHHLPYSLLQEIHNWSGVVIGTQIKLGKGITITLCTSNLPENYYSIWGMGEGLECFYLQFACP